MKIDTSSISHTTRNCENHKVVAPKYRRQVKYGKIKQDIGQIKRKLCQWKGVENNRIRSLPRPYTLIGVDTTRNKCIKFQGILKRKK